MRFAIPEEKLRDPGARAEPKEVGWLKPHEFAVWDNFVQRHPLGLIYHLSAWKEALENSLSHLKGRVLVVKGGVTGQIFAGIPVYNVRSWLLGHRIVSVPFASLCDPLLSTPSDFPLLFRLIEEWREQTASRYIEFRLLKTGCQLKALDYPVYPIYKHHYLELDGDREKLKRSFSRTAVRRMIAKAEKGGYTIKIGKTEEDLEQFYRLFSRTRKKLSLPSMPHPFFRSLWKHLGSTHVSILLACLGEQVISGVLALKFKEIFALEFAGDLPEFRKTGVNQLLYWEAMKQAINEGFKIFSFGRTYSGNSSLRAYKDHWGSKEEDLYFLLDPASPFRGDLRLESSFGYNLAKRIIGRLPSPVYRLIGNFCYRHLG